MSNIPLQELDRDQLRALVAERRRKLPSSRKMRTLPRNVRRRMIITMFERGRPLEEIAQRVGFSLSHVRQLTAKNPGAAEKRRNYKRARIEQEAKEVWQVYSKIRSLADTAVLYGKSRQWVKTRIEMIMFAK